MRRGPLVRVGLVLLGAVIVPLALTAPAFAHSDTGILAVEALPPGAADPSAVTVRARLVYDNDMHGVPGAAVTASGIGPDGATLPEALLGDVGEGEYESVITFPSPGAWTLTISALDPVATAALSVDVAATSPATTTPATTIPPSSTTQPSDDGGDDDDGPPVVLLIALGAVVVAGITATIVVIRRRAV